MKTRIKFSKCGSMRFVGHLDVMRYFQKAFRRAQIPVSYSQGFSPHQLMSFSSPLGIGLSSDGEYMDLTLDQVEDADRIVRPSMAMLAACDYMIAAKPDKTSFLERVDLEELVHRFMEQSSITILKKTKRSEKEVDIRDNIYHLSTGLEQLQGHTGMKYGESCLEGSAYRPLLYMQLTAGSVVNIKPELVLEAMAAFAGDTFSFLDVQIHRLEMYGDADGKKGEVHTFSSETPCRLLPLSEYDKA